MYPGIPSLDVPPRRIIVHWTGGAGFANEIDRSSYHWLTQSDRTIVAGLPAHLNMRKLVAGHHRAGVDYAAHTARFNSFSLGVSICGMLGARPGGPYGPHAITAPQWYRTLGFLARLCIAYGLDPLSPDELFHHEEAYSIHRVPQPGKWDITVLPWRLAARDVGGRMRRHVDLLASLERWKAKRSPLLKH